MNIMICTKCGKLKKSDSPPDEKRISGEKVFKRLQKWTQSSPEIHSKVKIKAVGCLDQCKKSPVILVRDTNTFYKKLTKEKLKKLILQFEGEL